jgi:alpha-galactosidase
LTGGDESDTLALRPRRVPQRCGAMKAIFITGRPLAFGILLLFARVGIAATNGLGLTPPMGFNTWFGYGSAINESIIQAAADAMATNGLSQAGYQYICVDDGWAGYRDTNGFIVPDTNKFPSGMKVVADYVHSRGFKFGIYTETSATTSVGLPGSFGYYAQDARSYASWGVDYVKADGDWRDSDAEEKPTIAFIDELTSTGRPMFINIGSYGFRAWMPAFANSWRFAGVWGDNINFSAYLNLLDECNLNAAYAGPGGWNDPDALHPANDEEARTEMTMNSIISAPLLLSQCMPDDSRLRLYTNAEVIAVDQDPLGVQGVLVASNGDLQVWCRTLAGNRNIKAFALLNRGTNTATITAAWSDLEFPSGSASIRDLWANAYAGNFTNSYSASVPGHGAQMLKIFYGAAVPVPPPGTNYLSNLEWLSSTLTTNIYPTRLNLNTAGGPIQLQGILYTNGLGTASYSRIDYYLGGCASEFLADIGIDSSVCCGFGSVVFRVWGDGNLLYDSGVITGNSPARSIDVDVRGRTKLTLEVTDAGDGPYYDEADWAAARIVVAPLPPRFVQARIDSGTLLLVGECGTLGRPGGAYYLLNSTNPSLPLSQWPPLLTNHFEPSANFSLTLSMPANAPCGLYRLQLP